MGLLTETNAQYYSGQKDFGVKDNTSSPGSDIHFDTSSYNTELISAFDSSGSHILSSSNYEIYYKSGPRVTSIAGPLLANTYPLNIGDIRNPLGGSGSGLEVEVINNNSEVKITNIGLNYSNGDLVEIPVRLPPTPTYQLTVAAGQEYEKLDESLSYISNNSVVLRDPQANTYSGSFYIQLKQSAIDNNYGSYAYITLDDIINNFIVGYVGAGKLIAGAKRTDIMFHAKRGLQEFSYDTLKSIKSQELTIPPSLSVIIPQDYVNYIKCSWIDDAGAKHIIYPTRVTSNPVELPLQDDKGIPTQDNFEENIEANNSLTDDRWASQSSDNKLAPKDYRFPEREFELGKRYGIQPEEAQVNGKFTINERLGTFSFTSDLVGKLIILEYISDGLAIDADTKVPKMAEQAMYMHIAHGILSGRANVPEYIINRYKIK